MDGVEKIFGGAEKTDDMHRRVKRFKVLWQKTSYLTSSPNPSRKTAADAMAPSAQGKGRPRP